MYRVLALSVDIPAIHAMGHTIQACPNAPRANSGAFEYPTDDSSQDSSLAAICSEIESEDEYFLN